MWGVDDITDYQVINHFRLQLKQPQIPVFFLTQANSPKYSIAVDVRGHSVYDAVAFAKSQNFTVSIYTVYKLYTNYFINGVWYIEKLRDHLQTDFGMLKS